MKRALLLILGLILVFSSARAEVGGNGNNGGFVAAAGETVFLAASDGIYRLDGAQTTRIYEGQASMLSFVGERLYFLAETWESNEYEDIVKTAETPLSCLADGSDLLVLSAPRPCGQICEYAPSGQASRIDLLCGYRGFTVTDDAIYFLGNSDLSGTYTCTVQWFDADDTIYTESQDGRYENGVALYRMDRDGGNLTALTGALGNSIACLAVDGDRIFVAGGWQDTLYAYNFVNYMIFDLEGNLLSLFENPSPNSSFVSDRGAFYHITTAIIADGNDMLVSLSDSEGDFMASQFCRLSGEGELTPIALEQNFIPSLLDGTTLYYIGSLATDNVFDDSISVASSLGIYRKDLHEDGLGMKLVALPFSEYMYAFRMNVVGDFLYFRGADGVVWRVPTSGGAKTAFTENGF